jgi:sugar (pentulose or hexulose) kinase
VLDLVREAAGEELGEIELAGRGTADEVWAMVAAQTLGARVRLRIHTDPELSARGAAMLAAACTGVPLAEATTSLGDEVLVVTPTAADLVAADRAAARYLAASDVALDWLDREIGRVAAGGPR